MRVVGGAALSALAVVFLSGCTELSARWGDRYGPAPVPASEEVAAAVKRETLVVQAMAQGTGLDTFPTSRAGWYGVILTGFNTVDDACVNYINDLWKFDREKGRVKDILTATGAATAAIVAANAHPSAATLSVLAQSFGLASALTGAVADSYLFTQNPATIKKLVKKSMDAYRDDLAKNFAVAEYPMNSPAAAYYHMREYLSLCLPPTIQGQIEDLLAKAQAAPVGSATMQQANVAKAQATAKPAVVGSTNKAKATTNIQLY